MYSDHDTHRWVGCPIRISTDQSLLAAPHGFSQRATSFIASWCQGIHRMPLSRSITPHAQKPPTTAETVIKRIQNRSGNLAQLYYDYTYTNVSDRSPVILNAMTQGHNGSDQPGSRYVQKRTNLFTLTMNITITG